MYEIEKNIINNIVINKSNFITYLLKIEDEEDAKEKIENLRKEYRDATHCCYAYVTSNSKKSSDDGEPGGTAGIPILEVLIKNNITNILCVVIRYFGGIKLGAGGLVRAYSKSVKEALNKTTLLQLIPSFEVEIIFSYDKVKLIDNILKNIDIKNKKYNESIKYIINIESTDNETINNLKNICTSYKIIKNSYVTKRLEK